jgi:hypothetical protein
MMSSGPVAWNARRSSRRCAPDGTSNVTSLNTHVWAVVIDERGKRGGVEGHGLLHPDRAVYPRVPAATVSGLVPTLVTVIFPDWLNDQRRDAGCERRGFTRPAEGL